MHTSFTPASPARASAARYLSCLRAREIVVLQGPALLGAAFAFRHLTVEHIGPLVILTLANVCLVAHVFVVNDWANLTTDRTDPARAASVFTVKGVASTEMGGLAAALLGLSLILFASLGLRAFCLAVGIATLSALYSLPPFNWKGRPLLSSAAHLLGGVLHFLLGYGLGGAIDRRGLVAATFFGLTFAAGHLIQELRDYEVDLRNTIRTNAVTFGRRRTLLVSLALFTVAQAVLFFLAVQGAVPGAVAASVLLYPFHVRWSLQTLTEGLTRASISRLQARYRALYAMIGLVMLAALWID